MGTKLAKAITEIDTDVNNIETDQDLLNEFNFNNRTDALDVIDFHIIGRIDSLLSDNLLNKELLQLKQRAEVLKQTLEIINIDLFEKLRMQIASGEYDSSLFVNMVDAYVEIGNAFEESIAGYDNLDLFINGLLTTLPLPEPTITRQAEMVFYQQTPARIIFQLAQPAKLTRDDVFFDLGSGLGQVAILINLLSGSITKGIEYDPAYWTYAKDCAASLTLDKVEFINIDARLADYRQGTLFFMYTPFTGQILAAVLALLREEAQNKMIRLFTYGPCSAKVAQEDWLTCVNGDGNDVYRLYEFRAL